MEYNLAQAEGNEVGRVPEEDIALGVSPHLGVEILIGFILLDGLIRQSPFSLPRNVQATETAEKIVYVHVPSY